LRVEVWTYDEPDEWFLIVIVIKVLEIRLVLYIDLGGVHFENGVRVIPSQ
jgi:hypothetical protein